MQVLLALALGMLTGVVCGELVASFQVIGTGFILLLQMTVLPYVTLSLITGLGRLTYQEVKSLALKVGLLLLITWVLAFAVILVMPFAFPAWESASFFSTSLLEEPPAIDFLSLYIPANPFYSLANSVVPAVVVFSVAIGIALIGMENKRVLLEPLTVMSDALMRVTSLVAKLTPLGVFAIVASAAGTMGLEELGRLQVFLVTYVLMAMLLTFLILPSLVTSLTPLTYRQVVGHTRDVLIMAFATGSDLIVLPLLIERCKELLRQLEQETDSTESTVEVILPAFFNFPKIGTLMHMSFVLFAGWFSGSIVSVTQYPALIMAGLASLFGSTNVAIPFLLDLMRIPADMFQLFVATGVITFRVGKLLSTMHNLVLALVGACAVSGLLTVHWRRIVRNAVLSLGMTTMLILGAHNFFTFVLGNAYEKDEIIAGMQLLRRPYPATVYTEPPPSLPPLPQAQASRLQRVQTRGALRACYRKAFLPFSHVNAAGDLVGFDIEMAQTLARDMDVALELVPVELATMAARLNAGYCDIVMSVVAITPQRAQEMAFADSHMDATLAFIVKDHRRDEFKSWSAIQRLKAPRIGVGNTPYYIAKIRRHLPQAEIVLLSSVQEFFSHRGAELDALAFGAEVGAAWSLLHPAYTVVVPRPDILTVPVAYAMAHGDREMVDFINNWLMLKKKDKTIDKLYDYWILGKDAVPQQPRWSVLRNLLHWVE
ncbi:MAG: cation:dicarboxylase symporter family transporter [Candidatus Tectomicrobia bacterium]|nr:cation:dicarboxylase symporter family transporter [Candidatus Tectomicrobia bacterium]